MRKRLLSILLALALCLSLLPAPALAAQDSEGLCPHHTAHTEACGYIPADEGRPCQHEHAEDCYTLLENCVHSHTDACYPQESVSGDVATPPDADKAEPVCAHECSEESGCVTKELGCKHEHNSDCAYTEAVPGTPCAYLCEKCAPVSDSGAPPETPMSGPLAAPTPRIINDRHTTEDGLIYKETGSGEVQLIGYDKTKLPNGPQGDLTVPQQITAENGKTYDVTSIGPQAFSGCEGLQKLTLQEGLESIGNMAFNWCSSLKELTLPKSWISIGDRAFSGCGLTSLELPEGWTSIGNSAFYDCGLKELKLPGSLRSIGDSAFSGCDLTSLELPEGLQSIGDSAFSSCDLTSLELPESLESIGNMAFIDCVNLQTLKLLGSRTSIGDSAFARCTSLKELELPEGLTSIGNSAFFSCTSLQKLTLPEGLTSIGDNAFFRCTSLQKLTLPGSLTFIGRNAFYDCNGLTFYVKNNAVALLLWSSGVEEKNIHLEGGGDLGFPQENPFSKDGIFYQPTGPDTVAVIGYNSQIGDLVIPPAIEVTNENGEVTSYAVTSIGDSAFFGSLSLQNLTLPESLTSIGDSAFSGCTYLTLTKLNLPGSLTSIGDWAFQNCTSLALTELPGSLRSIGDSAFYGCKDLTGLKLPEGLQSIGDEVFQNCTSLALTELPGSLRSIGDSAFSGCNGLKGLQLPEGLESIGKEAFQDCKNLTLTELPGSLRSIGDRAFWGCNSLKGTEIRVRGGSLQSVGAYAFPEGVIFHCDHPAAQLALNQSLDFGANWPLPIYLWDGKSDILDGALATLDKDTTLTGDLTIGDGSGLIIPDGVTLTNDGEIIIEQGGKIIIKDSGKIINNGAIKNYGEITGEDNITGKPVQDTASTTSLAFWKGGSPLQNNKATYGDTITVIATMQEQTTKNRAVAQDKVEFAVKENGLTHIAEVKNNNGVLTATWKILDSNTWDANEYTITADFGGGSGLLDSTASETLTINKAAAPAITWPTSATSLTYGQKLSESTLNGGDTKGLGVFRWTNPNEVPTVQNSGYSVTFEPFENTEKNYEPVLPNPQNVNVSVTKATLTATYQSETITQGGTPSLAVTVTGFVNGETAETAAGYQAPTVANSNTAPGNYTLTPEGGAADNYQFSYVSGTLTIKGSGGSSGDDSEPTYAIDLPRRTEGGTVTVRPTRAQRGEAVTITVKPDQGWELDALTVTDSKGSQLDLTDKGDGKFTFQMPGRTVTVDVTFTEIVEEPQPWINPFVDVQPGAWYYDAVEYVHQNGLMAGTSGNTFSPDVTTSRGMIVTILWRLAGSPNLEDEIWGYPFADVDSTAYYGTAVYWARLNGIANGYGDEKFGPNDPITREQLAVMLYNYAGRPPVPNLALMFSDADQVSGFADSAMRWAVDMGIISGKGNNILDPKGQATRAQAAAMLMRFCENDQ